MPMECATNEIFSRDERGCLTDGRGLECALENSQYGPDHRESTSAESDGATARRRRPGRGGPLAERRAWLRDRECAVPPQSPRATRDCPTILRTDRGIAT